MSVSGHPTSVPGSVRNVVPTQRSHNPDGEPQRFSREDAGIQGSIPGEVSMRAFSDDQIRQILHLDHGEDPLNLMPVGHPAPMAQIRQRRTCGGKIRETWSFSASGCPMLAPYLCAESVHPAACVSSGICRPEGNAGNCSSSSEKTRESSRSSV